MTSNSPNKGVSTSETVDPRTLGAEAAEGLQKNAAWRRKMDDNNAFLRNQVRTITNALELLLARTPQTTTEQPYMTRREGAWV